MFDLTDRVAVVTGASRGLGRHIAHELARGDCRVVMVARTPAPLAAAARSVETETGVPCLAIPADVTVAADRREILAQTENQFGPPDILVNNAGIVLFSPFTEEDPRRTIATNLEAPIELSRLFVPGMVQRGGGSVLNVGSVAGRIDPPFIAVYSAAKAGLIAFSLAAREELRGTGVGITVVSPGFIVDEGMYVPYRTRPPWYFGDNRAGVMAHKALKAMAKNRSHAIINARPVTPMLTLGAMSERAMRSTLRILGTTDFMRGLSDKRLPYSDSPELSAMWANRPPSHGGG